MVKIAYSLCGVGLGHCTRALALEKELGAKIRFFTYGDAYDYLKELSRDVELIDGMEFVYNKDGSIFNLKTAIRQAPFLLSAKPKMSGRYDLCITDWEPTMHSFARKLGVPCISVSSQHKFRFGNLPTQTWKQYLYTKAVGFLCRFFTADHYIVSTFQAEFVKQSKKVTPVWGFVSPDLDRCVRFDREILVYTMHEQIEGWLRCRFAHDQINVFNGAGATKKLFHGKLCSAPSVISTAGCQIVSECASLDIPLALVPIPGQIEQELNAYHAKLLDVANVYNVWDKQTPITKSKYSRKYVGRNGLDTAVEIIRSFL